jgi:ABC-type transport system, involved in lipoprotein release, permease component
MNSFSIAFKMFRNNLKTYGFYLAVMIFAIAVYYEFMMLKYDPSFLRAKDLIQSASVASSITSFVLIVFLFFFVAYSSSFFLKQRKKEIAIYSLMGISNRKIGRIFAIESLFTGITSIIAGLGFGVLFSRLFLMAVAKIAILETDIGFSIPMKGVKELLLVFGLIFIILSINSFISVAKSKLIDLIRDSQKEEKEPRFKIIRAIFSILLIGAGYYLSKNLAFGLIVVAIVILGTFWLFSALLPTIAKFLTDKKNILYKGVRIISISNVSFRIKANYRSLAMLAVLTATTITAFGTSLSLKYYIEKTHHIEFPYSFSYVLDDKKTDEKVIEAIDKSSHKLLTIERVGYFVAEAKIQDSVADDSKKPRYNFDFIILKYSDFQKISNDMEKQYPGVIPEYKEPKANETIIITAPATIGGYLEVVGKNARVRDQNFKIIQKLKTPVFGSGKLHQADCMVIADEQYNKLIKNKKPNVFNGYIVSDAKNSIELGMEIIKLMPKDTSVFVYAAKYMSSLAFIGLFYFLGSFMSIVFIFATGSIMYFKILSEGLADKGKYEILKKIGMTKAEIKKAVSIQVGLSLILPLIVGIIHSLFAIDVLRNMLDYSLLVPTLIAIAIYVVFYGIFYIATTRKFMKLVY